jgi:hypothetical protein
MGVFSPKRQSNQSNKSNRSNRSNRTNQSNRFTPSLNDYDSYLVISTQRHKPTSFHLYNDDNVSIASKTSKSHSELFSYHHLNKSDKQIYRYGYDSNNSSPRSFKFNHKYSSLDSSTLIGTNRHNSAGIYSLNSTFLGSLSNLSSPDNDEFHIYQKPFDVYSQKEGRASCSIDERRMISFDDDDDSIHNSTDKKEWLAKKPKRTIV